MARRLDGKQLAERIRGDLRERAERLSDRGHRPRLATVHMGEDPAAGRYVELKHRDCGDVGIGTRHVDLDPAAPAFRLYEAITRLNEDPDVDGVLVQKDVPEAVDWHEAVGHIDPEKDVDGVHPENVGRLVAGRPRYVPCTALGIARLLDSADVDLVGADVVVVNHSDIVGKPLANLLVQRTACEGPSANRATDSPTTDPRATVTVCHANSENVAEKTRRADVVVVAVGIPDFLDGSMITAGTTVVDVGITRVETDHGYRQVGDVDADSVARKADYLTPNPGGVGPMTRAMLLHNTVRAAARRADPPVEAPVLAV